MPALNVRGGVPRNFRSTVDTGGIAPALAPEPEAGLVLLPFKCQFLRIANEGANVLRVYWTEDDFLADAQYHALPATTGLLELPVEVDRFWTRSVTGATTMLATALQGRG